MAPKKSRGRAATSIARVARSRSMVVEYEPKPDCGPLEPVLELDGEKDEEIWTRGMRYSFHVCSRVSEEDLHLHFWWLQFRHETVR